MITGAHTIIYSKNAEKDRTFLKEILKLTNVDVGDGWLIFGLPPSEVAIHPASLNGDHELYLLCDDILEFTQQMSKFNIACSNIENQGWGLLTQLTLPGGGKIGVYEPRHKRPKPMTVSKSRKKSVVKSKKVAKKKSKRAAVKKRR
jgi:hypothetical protein